MQAATLPANYCPTLTVTVEDASLLPDIKRAIKMLKGVLAVRKNAVKKAVVAEEDEYITKEEILAGIASGLRDMKEGKGTPAEDFLKELRYERDNQSA